ncbi:unnamed protein product, partial [Prunus brigantina]
GNGVGPLQAVEVGNDDWPAVVASSVGRRRLAVVVACRQWWAMVARYGHVA